MTIKCVEISSLFLDKTQSHVQVEREPSGWFTTLGAIAHPDLMEMTLIPPRLFKSREQAIEVAIGLAGQFTLQEVLIVLPT